MCKSTLQTQRPIISTDRFTPDENLSQTTAGQTISSVEFFVVEDRSSQQARSFIPPSTRSLISMLKALKHLLHMLY